MNCARSASKSCGRTSACANCWEMRVNKRHQHVHAHIWRLVISYGGLPAASRSRIVQIASPRIRTLGRKCKVWQPGVPLYKRRDWTMGHKKAQQPRSPSNQLSHAEARDLLHAYAHAALLGDAPEARYPAVAAHLAR